MSYGLRTWDEQARLETDTTTFTYQVLLSELIDFGGQRDHATRTFNIAGFHPNNCVAVLLPVNLFYTGSPQELPSNCMPWIDVGVGVVSVRPSHPSAGSDPNGIYYQKSRLTVRLLVMRYKV